MYVGEGICDCLCKTLHVSVQILAYKLVTAQQNVTKVCSFYFTLYTATAYTRI